jgi:hypothetical protein
MGTDEKYWPSQLQNDLENFYCNEGVKIMGGYSNPDSLTSFKLVMYQVEMYERAKRFDLEVDCYDE